MSLQQKVDLLAARAGAEDKAIRTLLAGVRSLVNGGAADLASLQTTAKGSLVAAINEVLGAVASASGIDDATTSTSSSWSSSKTLAEIQARAQAAVDAVVGGAPDALDTLEELAAALADNPNALSALEQLVTNNAQAIAQLRTDMGDHTTDFVATFETALTA